MAESTWNAQTVVPLFEQMPQMPLAPFHEAPILPMPVYYQEWYGGRMCPCPHCGDTRAVHTLFFRDFEESQQAIKVIGVDLNPACGGRVFFVSAGAN